MKYRLYHVVDRVVPMVAMGKGDEAIWPGDYYHVADVEASSKEEVFARTNRNLRKKGGSWENNKGVHCYVSNPRSTAPGDVVMDENSRTIRFRLGEDEVIA